MYVITCNYTVIRSRLTAGGRAGAVFSLIDPLVSSLRSGDTFHTEGTSLITIHTGSPRWPRRSGWQLTEAQSRHLCKCVFRKELVSLDGKQEVEMRSFRCACLKGFTSERRRKKQRTPNKSKIKHKTEAELIAWISLKLKDRYNQCWTKIHIYIHIYIYKNLENRFSSLRLLVCSARSK